MIKTTSGAIFKKQPKLYTSGRVTDLAAKYADVGGEIVTIEEGCLGWGFTIMYAPGYKTAIIQEIGLNTWQVGHKVRFYNEMPKKYKNMIEDYYNNLIED